MSAIIESNTPEIEPLPQYQSILLAVDSSDHSNHGITEAIRLAVHFNSKITASHVYAAKLHDIRFRQMEGGLPEQFRQEEELERQRDVHDDLISRGLSIITDSYLDQVDRVAESYKIQVERRSLEGKNYREIVTETNNGSYDLLVMGALGLGAVTSSRIGTVCQRVARRSQIDTLIIKDPLRELSDGPIVVAIDGSSKAYGGLLSAFSLAKHWNVPIKVVSAFDPYYHYVAFNRIAGVLSEEAGKVFKFKEQEKLHEEIIDSGLAKIYQSHLAVAQSIAKDYGIEIETTLLDGKPHEVITQYLHQIKPSLLVLGTTGIHADKELDIGGNTEYLLSDVECNILLSQTKHLPQVDRLASATTSWTNEAENRMHKVPSFVRPMARMAILRYAQEHGHTVITEKIVDEATAQLMPGHAEKAMEQIVDAYDAGDLKKKPKEEDSIRWSTAATRLLLTIKDLSLRGNLSMRAEKKARVSGASEVEAEHLKQFIGDDTPLGKFTPGALSMGQTPSPAKSVQIETKPADDSIHWQAAALARLMRVPEGFMRNSSKQRIEDYARTHQFTEVSLEVAEAGLAEARKAMEANMMSQQKAGQSSENTPPDGTESASKCPFGFSASSVTPDQIPTTTPLVWNAETHALLDNVPAGFCRDMTHKAVENIARQRGQNNIDSGFVEEVLATFKSGSETTSETLPWDDTARERIAKAPDMVRGMLVQEIEGWSRRNNQQKVTEEAVEAVKQIWAERGVFHLNPDDPRNT